MLLTRGVEPVPDLDGRWTIQRAERHLRVGELAGARHECVDGRLMVRPFPPATESIAMAGLASAFVPAAEATGRHVFGRVNLTFSPTCWIQPDVTVLHTLPASDEEERWVPAALCTMAVEFVRRGAPPARRGAGPQPAEDRVDRVDRRRRCAEAGVPWFLRVALDRRPHRMTAELFRRTDGGGWAPAARAVGGQRLRVRAPFPIDFAPARLLP
ncbi:Uma2 family endonuclease [Micromonospora halophytica]|uniref:Putative restriction endonuclease n=1 Tax=Micromonospora halophytica TaxID=47864 RepID=A0A1C5ICI4_9ACTN|nr:Uma2 family endonuclease [Micromonospora halophytica]SCG55885.1 Putative restriction endonuclease [Micromonospora halophytica]